MDSSSNSVGVSCGGSLGGSDVGSVAISGSGSLGGSIYVTGSGCGGGSLLGGGSDDVLVAISRSGYVGGSVSITGLGSGGVYGDSGGGGGGGVGGGGGEEYLERELDLELEEEYIEEDCGCGLCNSEDPRLPYYYDDSCRGTFSTLEILVGEKNVVGHQSTWLLAQQHWDRNIVLLSEWK